MGDSRSSLSWCNRCKNYYFSASCGCDEFKLSVPGGECISVYAASHEKAVQFLAESTTKMPSFYNHYNEAFDGGVVMVTGNDGTVKRFKASVCLIVHASVEEL